MVHFHKFGSPLLAYPSVLAPAIVADVARVLAIPQETSKQHAAYRNLIVRNLDRPASALASIAAPHGAAPTALPLPFILIQVNPEASVEIQIADDNRQAMFDFAGCAHILAFIHTLMLCRIQNRPYRSGMMTCCT